MVAIGIVSAARTKLPSSQCIAFQASPWPVGPSGFSFIDMVTVVPLFSPSLVASMVPLLAATKALAIQKPRPRPGLHGDLFVLTAARRAGRRLRASSEQPSPTEKTILLGRQDGLRQCERGTRWPGGPTTAVQHSAAITGSLDVAARLVGLSRPSL
jgi:hypothetical protein